MNKKYIPTYHLKDIFSMSFDKLQALKIKNVFIDLDNTLANPYVSLPDENVRNFIKKFNELNIKVTILSNNHEKRVKTFASDMNVSYLYEVKKPKTKKLSNYITSNNINIDECIAIGDQVMTDVATARKLNIKVILVDPLTNQDEPITFIPRLLDRYYRKKLAKKNLLEEF